MPDDHRATIEGVSVTLPPTRSAWVVMGALAAAAFGGAAVGSAIAWALAPDSMLARFVGFMALPLVLGFGYQVWQARIALVLARRFGKGLIRLLWQAVVLRKRPAVESLVPAREDAGRLLLTMLQAASAFTHAGLVVGSVAGVLIALTAGSRFWLALVVTSGTSIAYGVALTRLARAGYLPPPDGSS